MLDIDSALGINTQPRCEIIRSGDEQFAMLRWQPDVSTENLDRAQNHCWVVVFEASADRDPVFARQQIEALLALIKARPLDEFRILTASRKTEMRSSRSASTAT